MGGVAHKPWRLHAAEDFLKGKAVSDKVFTQAATLVMQGAKAYQYNKFKLTMAPNVRSFRRSKRQPHEKR